MQSLFPWHYPAVKVSFRQSFTSYNRPFPWPVLPVICSSPAEYIENLSSFLRKKLPYLDKHRNSRRDYPRFYIVKLPLHKTDLLCAVDNHKLRRWKALSHDYNSELTCPILRNCIPLIHVLQRNCPISQSLCNYFC